MSTRGQIKLFGFAVLFWLLMPALSSATIQCYTLGGCQYCDFYGPNGEYQGLISKCN